MVNVYSIRSTLQDILLASGAASINRCVYRFRPRQLVTPGAIAPVVRNLHGWRELSVARWHLPTDAATAKDIAKDQHSRLAEYFRYVREPEHRCLVPFNRFATGAESSNSGAAPDWCALDKQRSLAWFAAVYLTSRKETPAGERDTTEDEFVLVDLKSGENAAPLSAGSTPFVLSGKEAVETWMSGSWDSVKGLRRSTGEPKVRRCRN